MNTTLKWQGFIKSLSSLALLLCAGQVNAIMVSIDESLAAAPGDEVSLDINITDLDGDVVTAYTMNVIYDTQYLAFEDVVFTSDSCINDDPSCTAREPLNDPSDGSITLDEDLKNLTVFGSSEPMTLATLSFTVLDGITDTVVTIDTTTAVVNKKIYRGNSESFTTGWDVIGPNNLTSATITNSINTTTEQDTNVISPPQATPTAYNRPVTTMAAAIPEPTTLALLGLGLAGLGFTRRRMKV